MTSSALQVARRFRDQHDLDDDSTSNGLRRALCAVVVVLALAGSAAAAPPGDPTRPSTGGALGGAAPPSGARKPRPAQPGANPSAAPGNDDLIKMGESLLDDPGDDKPKPAARDASVPPADLAPPAKTRSAPPDAAASPSAQDPSPPAAMSTPADAATPPDALVSDGAAPPITAAAPIRDAGARPDLLAREAPALVEEPAPVEAASAIGASARQRRVQSGKNLAMQGALDSPLASLGVPPAMVPVAATVATVGAMAFWPFLLKTLTGLLKGLVGAFIKNKGKKKKKVNDKQYAFVVFGFRLRPVELGSLLLGAVVYGLAVCYTFKGWRMDRPFVMGQEALVVGIYYARSMVRFVWERLFSLTTEYKFWFAGSVLCLGSALLGNTLGTVGFEVEAASTPEQANRAMKMKVWLTFLTLLIAVGFFAANVIHPDKMLQSGRVMTAGMALGEVIPINPMPGLKIYKWHRGIWAGLFLLVVPTFFLINFFL